MKSSDIRQSFLDFFSSRDHRRVPSAPLVPHGDPTLLFTNAGMVQFKDAFLGKEEPIHPRAVSVQKCLRVSGKHNDLENVGPSPRHHTFFEMLGNFSFGDYFKEEAIRYGWELVTDVWGLDPDRLFATVYEEDGEAEELWLAHSSLPRERVLRCGAKDNFWAMGETGPCGPCSEIFVDLHPGRPAVDWETGTENGRYLEIWNLVFMQFDRAASGEMVPLPDPSIDTGAGLERVAAVLQGVESNYDSDLFQPLLAAAASRLDRRYGADREADVSLRVIADHLRAVSFLLADGVIPGPDGRGYVLRRLLRRAVRHGMRIGFEEPFLHELVSVLGAEMGRHYPELEKTRDATVATVREEEEKYLQTRAAGARHVQVAIDRARQGGTDRLSGDELFALYDTHGLELEAVREIAQEEKLGLDEAGFERRLEERRHVSRSETGEQQQRLAALRDAIYGQGEPGATEFLGYDRLELDTAKVVRLASSAEGVGAVDILGAGQEGVAVLDRTPFYAESGGQVGDRGTLAWESGHARVIDTRKDTAGTVFHFIEVLEGSIGVGTEVRPAVDTDSRRATERNHTATHLLHAALREVLGEGVRQAGSLVAPDRLRFDFTFSRPLDDGELERLEDIVNAWVRRAVPTGVEWSDYPAAVAAGAMALFGEKYGDRVRTVAVPGFSLELCGGCHVGNSGEIGLFLITSERGVASGVRRIEAVTGEPAFARVRSERRQLAAVAEALGVPGERAGDEIEALRTRVKAFERELAKLRLEVVSGASRDTGEHEVAGVRLIAREVPPAPANELRTMADSLRQKLGTGVVVLATREEDKVALVVAVTSDLVARVQAGNLVRVLAPMVGGGGGGRADFAQAGGRQPERLAELLEAVPRVVSEALGD